MQPTETAPTAVPRGPDATFLWRRFELTTSDPGQIRELEQLLTRLNLTRAELALIVLSLRVRPGFELRDFDT